MSYFYTLSCLYWKFSRREFWVECRVHWLWISRCHGCQGAWDEEGGVLQTRDCPSVRMPPSRHSC